METLTRILEFVLVALYFSALTVYILDFNGTGAWTRLACRIIVPVTLATHIFHIFLIIHIWSRSPVGTIHEFASGLAFGLLVIYLFLEYRFKSRSLGPWIVGAATIMMLASLIGTNHNIEPEPIFSSIIFYFHTLFGVLAYAGLLISGIFSVMYIILYRTFKQKKFGVFFDKFPPLATLGEMNFQAMFIGEIMLSIMIPLGFMMVLAVNEEIVWDFKFCMVLTTWSIYLIGLLIGKFAGWRGNRLAIYSTSALFGSILGVGAAMLKSSSHAWY